MQYLYSTARGIATLNKGDDYKLVKLGKFKTEAEALAACKKHYVKASKALQNLGKQVPQALFG
jgi:hypothetical protein